MSVNAMNCALTGVRGATLVRRPGTMQPIGEVYKSADGWRSYAGYDIPTEYRGTWDYKVEAVAAINEADRLYKQELNGGFVGSI
jgi:hypothetical protein